MQTLKRALVLFIVIYFSAQCGGAIGWSLVQHEAQGQEPQHRAGICALNTGQLVREDSAFVRTGNSGWDYGCVWVQLDVADPGGLWAGLSFAPTVVFSWEKRLPSDEISRYSWRPGYHYPGEGGDKHREDRAFWIIPEVGWFEEVGPLELRPSVGLAWLTDLGYHFGAPWGPDLPFLGLDVLLTLPKGFFVGANARAVYKRPHGLTVLEQWAGQHKEPAWKPHARLDTFVEAKAGVAF